MGDDARALVVAFALFAGAMALVVVVALLVLWWRTRRANEPRPARHRVNSLAQLNLMDTGPPTDELPAIHLEPADTDPAGDAEPGDEQPE
jgi:hypothetical protein